MSTAAIISSNLCAIASSAEQSFALPATLPAVGRSPQIAVYFPDIKFERTIFRLNRPVELTLDRVDGGWTCEEQVFSLFGFGKSSMEAICSVFEDFAVLWDEIANVPDESLSEDAQRTKLTLLAFVKSVDENS
jgi:hypothetical protein